MKKTTQAAAASMTPQARRLLVERIFAKAQERGEHIEDDPQFATWVEQWIAGEIDLDQLRRNYQEFLHAKRRYRV